MDDTNCLQFPEHWWGEYKQNYEWEILPQAAKPGEVILSKQNELGLLSNFAPTPFVMDGREYASIEGFWHSLKYPENPEDPRRSNKVVWPYHRNEVEKLTGLTAWEAGEAADKNLQTLGIDWVSYKGEKMLEWTEDKNDHYELIKRAMVCKLEQNLKVFEILKSTKGLKLKPDHDQPENAPPSWRYFDIYMELRDQGLYVN